MEINAFDLLTDEQKTQLSEIAYKKIKNQIQQIEFTKKEIDLVSIIETDIKAYVESGDGFFGSRDANKVGNEITSLLVRLLKRAGK